MHSVGRTHNFRRVSNIAKSDCLLGHICVFVRVAVRLEHLGFYWTDFSWKFMFGDFSKICWENTSFIKIWQ